MSIEVGKTYKTNRGDLVDITSATTNGYIGYPHGEPRECPIRYDGFGVPVNKALWEDGWAIVEDAPEEDDGVNSPSHYTVGGFEALDVIRAKLTKEEFRGYCKGNTLKYLMRANYKNDHDKDCKKAAYYGNKLEDSL